MNGISVIICCYNSANVLHETLVSISKQVVYSDISWEVLLIDNASTDDTATHANKIWQSLQSPISFKIIYEARPGLSHARQAGIRAAQFDCILFCDDDNILSPTYLQTGADLLLSRPNVAMLGGKGIPKTELPVPAWFERYAYHYAVGPQAEYSKDITKERGFVYGAGCFLRAAAYHALLQKGFQYTLSGRKGTSLLSGEDNELCYALSLAGYEIYYEEKLEFEHVLSHKRLTLTYLKKLRRAVAYSSVLLIPYIEGRNEVLLNKKSSFNWTKKILSEFLYLINGYVKYPFAAADFKTDILMDRQARLGSIHSLIANRKLLVNRTGWLKWL
jgi:glycosyltransferase involved in cell wall biosynthesis